MNCKALSIIAAALALHLGSGAALANSPTASHKTMTAFASEAELAELFRGWAEEYRKKMAEQRSRRDAAGQSMDMSAAKPASAPQALASAGALAKSEAAAESVTNVQHAGVDEGGIVKVHGDHLVILRRGRLFTVAVNDKQLKPVSYADAYGEGVAPGGAWYDEMLLWGNTVAVIGYSYARGGTEIGLFEISRSGQLTHKSTHHLRSNDYYSSRNYASRLIGSKLVFYTPLYLNPWGGLPTGSFPALRKWRPGATPAEFKRIAPATRIYRSDDGIDPQQGVALHSVTVCDLARAEMNCDSTAVLGQPGRVFYVSPGSVYVWNVRSGIFRIPLDGSAPSMLKASGSPVDQFSFLESDDGHLNVLVRAHGRGDGMWAAEAGSGALAMLRVPLAAFSDGRDAAPAWAYRALPKVQGHALQNRYVGNYLLYGAGAGWRRPQAVNDGRIYAVDYARGSQAYELPLAHGVDRIEALGANAVAVGSNGRDLHFTSLRLARIPVAASSYVRANASQGETRSHGFFYKAESEHAGLVGLPIIGGGEAAGRQLRRESASLLYLRNDALSLTEIGTLDSRAGAVNDRCKASCVDWYGNSRPLFLRNRVFALLGYEIVEGRVNAGGISELRRINFAPQQQVDEIAP
jgi:hypothetical protein